jgi:hypothetical protein
MASILTFDVAEKHIELKKALIDLGYNTTLYHPNKTPEQAVVDVQMVCERLKIHLDHCLATNWIKWHAMTGHSSQKK